MLLYRSGISIYSGIIIIVLKNERRKRIMTETKNNNVSYYVWSVIGLLFMFGFGKVVPPFAGITPVGVSILGVFIGVLIIILATNETFWPCVMGLFAIVMCGYTTASGILGTWFGNVTIQQIIWVMALTGAVTESGAVNVLARKMLSIKALKGHPVRFITVFFITVLVGAALVSSPTTMLLLFYPIVDSICEMCGIEKDTELKRELLLGVFIAAMGAYILPFKGIHLSSIAIISGIMKAQGLAFNNGIYLLVATLVVVVFVAVYILFIRFVWKTDLTPLKEFDVAKMNFTKEDLKLNGRQKTLLGFMIFGIVFLIISMFLPAGSAVLAFYNSIGSTWIWIVLFIILCALRDKEGKPFINGPKLLQTKTMWGIIATAGCFTILGTAIASTGEKGLGICAAIQSALSPILGNASWPIMVLLCVAASCIFTNFTNGMPISFTINAVCIPIACAMGAGKASVLAVATIMSAMCAFLTHGAIAYAPLFLNREEVTKKFVFTKGVVTNVIYILVATIICVVFGYIF